MMGLLRTPTRIWLRNGLMCSLLSIVAIVSAAFAPAYWRDSATGLAIGGFDPIEYFSHGVSRRGHRNYEAVWRGVSWRFVNSGNQAEFKKNPTVYAPGFAGYDPTAIAEGILVTGHPRIWAIHDTKLYLFHDPVDRALWVKNPDGVIAKAAEVWKTLSLELPVAEAD